MLSTECQYPQNKPKTAYTKGCRCCGCVEATKKSIKEYRQRNPDQVRKWKQEHYRRNAEKICAQAKKYRQLNSEKIRLRQKVQRRFNYTKVIASERRRKYGMRPEDYDNLLRSQRGVCAICQKPDKSGRALAVDHCHATNKVRGLLCGNCNRGIGCFGDEVERCKAAANYLLRFTDG